MNNTIILKVPCQAAYIKVIRDTFHSFAETCDADDSIKRDGKICISELASNIIKHAAEEKQITVQFKNLMNSVEIEFHYTDHDFDMNSVKQPDIHALESGGYGLHIVKKI